MITKEGTTMTHKVITEVAGEDTLVLVAYLKGKKNVSEFVIAKDMKMEINTIRNMLYRLLDSNLVTFTRKKDKQKGWYIYYWTYQPKNIDHLFWEIKKKRLEGLKDRLFREKQNVFFVCPKGCIRLEFENAISFDYRCPECGSMLGQQDNAGLRVQLETEISELTTEISDRNQKRTVYQEPKPRAVAKISAKPVSKKKK